MKHRYQKGLAALLSLCLIAGVFSCAFAGEPTLVSPEQSPTVHVQDDVWRIGDYLFRVLEDDTCELVEYVGEDGIRELPGEIAGHRVTAIGAYAFSNQGNLSYYTDEYPDYHREYIRSVQIPEGVTAIGDYAFVDCFNLIEITLPSTLQRIGKGAFAGCDSLMVADLPDALRELGDYAFQNCTSLTNLRVPDQLQSLGANPFADCTHLSLTLSPSHPIFSYENGMLIDRTTGRLVCFTTDGAAESVQVPEGVLILGESAFSSASFESVVLPDSLTAIGSYAFSHCQNLRELVIPANVTKIDRNPVRGCSSLQSVTVSNPQSGFVVRDDTLIDEQAHRFIAYLRRPSRPEDDGSSEKGSQKDLPQEIEVDGVKMRLLIFDFPYTYDPEPPYEAYTVPSDIEEIGACAFYQAEIGSISMPDTVRVLGEGAFEQSCLDTEIQIPAQVTVLPDRLFYGCEHLAEISVPDGLVSIGEFAFAYSGIQEISLLDSLVSLGRYAFASCSQLREIELSPNLTRIPRGAFLFSGLESVEIPEKVTVIEAEAFARCASLDRVQLPSQITSVPEFCFYDSSIREANLPSQVEYIGDHAFQTDSYNSSQLQSISLPEGLKYLGTNAFKGADGLQEVTLPDSVVALGEGVFEQCYRLKQVHLPGTLAAIGDRMFYACPLESVEIPAGITRIGAYAFADCEKLSRVVLPDTLTDIGERAFRSCTGLEQIDLPDSVSYLGAGAFAFSGLTSFRFPNVPVEIAGNPFESCAQLSSLQVDDSHPNLALKDDLLIDVPGKRVISCLSCGEDKARTVPEGIEIIGANAFTDADLEKGITLPSSLKVIESEALSSRSLKEIRLPAGLKVIGDRAFEFAPLEEILLPDGLEEIGDGAFSGASVESIVIPPSVKRMGASVFSSSLKKLEFSLSPIALSGCPLSTWGSKTEIILPEGHPTLELVDGNLYSLSDHRLLALLTDQPIQQGTLIIENSALLRPVAIIPASVTILRYFGADWFYSTLTSVYIVPGSPAEAFFDR